MQASQIPTKFPLTFGADAGGAYIRPIPTASQIGIQAGAASLTDGFPPATFTPVGAGGTPPFGQDLNGILNQLTAWAQWQSAGGAVPYDSAFQTAIGGYPKGAFVASAVVLGDVWMSTVDNNTTNPDTGGAGWTAAPGMLATGDTKWSAISAVPFGFVAANANTIGNASSNATGFADPSTQLLFSWLWNNFNNTQCPIFTSTGSPSTRGASAAADYAANKAITVLDLRGTARGGVDTMGGGATTRLAGVPFVSGSATLPGSVAGENTHTLVTAELAAHNHGVTDPGHLHVVTDPGHNHVLTDPGHVHPIKTFGSTQQSGGTELPGGGVGGLQATVSSDSATTGITIAAHTTGVTNQTATTGITIANTGSGTAHNNVQREMLGYWLLKL